MDVVTLESLVTELATPRAGAQVRAITLARVVAAAIRTRSSMPLGVADYFFTAADADKIRADYRAARAVRAIR